MDAGCEKHKAWMQAVREALGMDAGCEKHKAWMQAVREALGMDAGCERGIRHGCSCV